MLQMPLTFCRDFLDSFWKCNKLFPETKSHFLMDESVYPA